MLKVRCGVSLKLFISLFKVTRKTGTVGLFALFLARPCSLIPIWSTVQHRNVFHMASSSSSTPKRPINDLLSNIHNLMPMKLKEDSNFDVWKYQMTAILGAYDLMGYVDGSLSRSDVFWTADEAIWCREDQAVMAAINATLSPWALEQVCNCTTSRGLWLELRGLRFS